MPSSAKASSCALRQWVLSVHCKTWCQVIQQMHRPISPIKMQEQTARFPDHSFRFSTSLRQRPDLPQVHKHKGSWSSRLNINHIYIYICNHICIYLYSRLETDTETYRDTKVPGLLTSLEPKTWTYNIAIHSHDQATSKGQGAPTPSAPPSQVPLPPVDPSSLQRLPLCQPGHLCHLRTSVSLTGPLKNTFAQSCAKLAAPLEQLLVMSSLRTRCHASGLLGAGALHLNKKPLEREQNASNILLWHNNWAIPGTGEQLWQCKSLLWRVRHTFLCKLSTVLATAGFQQLIFKVISHMEERYGLMIFSTVSYSQLCDQVISSDV